MATDKESLTLRLRLACVGHPTAEIPWPHRILHEAADEIADLTARLAEAERRSELESTQEAELDMVLPLKKTRPRGMQAIRDDRARRAIALIDDLRERLTDCNLAYMDARENYKVELARAIRDRDELRAEVARLTDCLKKANDSIEKYERLYYLEMDARETAEARLVALREAVEKAPHGSACLYLIPRSAPMGETRTAGCNCWKKSALDKSAE